MRIRVPGDEGRQLEALVEAARPTRTLSASAWVRGAVRAALADDGVAEKIVDAAPDTGHGGLRRGAGRPKSSPVGPSEDGE